MSQPSQNTSLSLSARLLCYLGPPSAILLTAIASPRTALLTPLACLSTALFFRNWRNAPKTESPRRGELEPIIWIYAASGTVGLAMVVLAQIVICSATSKILFRSSDLRKAFWDEFGRSTVADLSPAELVNRAALASSWQNWVFNGIFSFLMAGLVEETLKYLPIAFARRRGTREERKQRDRAYVDYALVGTLSFSVVEAIGFLYTSCEKGNETGSKLALTIVERVVAGCFGHLLPAALTALRAIRRDYYGNRLSWWEVVGPSLVLHGASDFVALSFSALDGNVGWIHPTGVQSTVAMIGLISGVLSTAALLVRREWKAVVGRDQQRK